MRDMSPKMTSWEESIGHPPGLVKMYGANAMRDMAAHKRTIEAQQKQCHNRLSTLSSLSAVVIIKDTSTRTRTKSEMLEFRAVQRKQKKEKQKAHKIRVKEIAMRDIEHEDKLIIEALQQDTMRQVDVQQMLIEQFLKQKGNMNEELQQPGMSEWIAGDEDDAAGEEMTEDMQEQTIAYTEERRAEDMQAQTFAYTEEKQTAAPRASGYNQLPPPNATLNFQPTLKPASV